MVEFSDAQSDGITRRQCLSIAVVLAGAATSAGCLSWNQTGATDVFVYSLAPSNTTVTVTITDIDSTEPHTSQTRTLSQGDQTGPVNDSKLPTNTSYTIEVAIEDGASGTFDWTDPDIELAPLYIAIEDSQTINFRFNAG